MVLVEEMTPDVTPEGDEPPGWWVGRNPVMGEADCQLKVVTY